jgi:hypothetical protein
MAAHGKLTEHVRTSHIGLGELFTIGGSYLATNILTGTIPEWSGAPELSSM